MNHLFTSQLPFEMENRVTLFSDLLILGAYCDLHWFCVHNITVPFSFCIKYISSPLMSISPAWKEKTFFCMWKCFPVLACLGTAIKYQCTKSGNTNFVMVRSNLHKYCCRHLTFKTKTKPQGKFRGFLKTEEPKYIWYTFFWFILPFSCNIVWDYIRFCTMTY